MKKFLSCVMGAVFAFTTVAVAASCGEEGDKAPLKVTVEVAETATTVCGADYKVPDAVVQGSRGLRHGNFHRGDGGRNGKL